MVFLIHQFLLPCCPDWQKECQSTFGTIDL
jgi:hypothetical protein